MNIAVFVLIIVAFVVVFNIVGLKVQNGKKILGFTFINIIIAMIINAISGGEFLINDILERMSFRLYLIIIYFIVSEIVVIIYMLKSEKNDDLRKLNMHIPKESDYNNILNSKLQNVYIRTLNFPVSAQEFFISDYDGNLLYYIKQDKMLGLTVYNPFKKNIGRIDTKILNLLPKFDIKTLNSSFSLERKFNMYPKYITSNLNISIDGDFWGMNYNVIDSSKNIIAHITPSTANEKEIVRGNADISFVESKQIIEIICICICVIMGESKMKDYH